MLELGENTVSFHETVAEEADKTADIILFVGENWQTKQRSSETHLFSLENKSGAARFLKENVKAGDVLLFKGSNRIGLDETIKEAGL